MKEFHLHEMVAEAVATGAHLKLSDIRQYAFSYFPTVAMYLINGNDNIVYTYGCKHYCAVVSNLLNKDGSDSNEGEVMTFSEYETLKEAYLSAMIIAATDDDFLE